MANFKLQTNNAVLTDGCYITNLCVEANNITATSNVTARYFIGDGSLLTGISGGGGGGGGGGGTTVVIDTESGSANYNTNAVTKSDGAVVNIIFDENPGISGIDLTNPFTITVSEDNLILDPEGTYLSVGDTITFTKTHTNLRLVSDGTYWYLLGDNTDVPTLTPTSNAYVTGAFSSNAYNQGVYSSNAYNQSVYAGNVYVTSTFSSNAYTQDTFVSNNYLTSTYSSNTYIADTFVSNNYLSTGQVRMREVQLRGTGINDQVLIAGNNTLGQYFSIVPELGSGGFTSLSQAGDIGLIFTTDLVGSNNEDNGLVIAPWSASGYGFRMTEQGDFYYSGNSHIFYGQLRAFDYGSGTHTGTAAYTLQVDSSGNIIEGAVGSGSVSNSYATDTLVSNTYAQSAFDPIGEAAALAIALG